MKKTLKIRLFLNIGIIITCLLAVILVCALLFYTELPIWACSLIALSPAVLFLLVIWATRFFSQSHTEIGCCPACGASLWRIYSNFAILEPNVCPYCGYDLDADEPTPEERLSYDKVISPPDEDAENKELREKDISDRK